jgi:hypothetical protein
VPETSTPIFQVFAGCWARTTAQPASNPNTTPTTLKMFFLHDDLTICFFPPIPHSRIESLKHDSHKDAKAARVTERGPSFSFLPFVVLRLDAKTRGSTQAQLKERYFSSQLLQSKTENLNYLLSLPISWVIVTDLLAVSSLICTILLSVNACPASSVPPIA